MPVSYTHLINEGVAWDHIPLTWAMEQLVAKADAVCFGTLAQRSEISRKTIMRPVSYTHLEIVLVVNDLREAKMHA